MQVIKSIQILYPHVSSLQAIIIKANSHIWQHIFSLKFQHHYCVNTVFIVAIPFFMQSETWKISVYIIKNQLKVIHCLKWSLVFCKTILEIVTHSLWAKEDCNDGTLLCHGKKERYRVKNQCTHFDCSNKNIQDIC